MLKEYLLKESHSPTTDLFLTCFCRYTLPFLIFCCLTWISVTSVVLINLVHTRSVSDSYKPIKGLHEHFTSNTCTEGHVARDTNTHEHYRTSCC